MNKFATPVKKTMNLSRVSFPKPMTTDQSFGKIKSMVSNLFLGMATIGAEWVLYLLILLSLFSVALIFDRWRFYQNNGSKLSDTQNRLRTAITQSNWDEAIEIAEKHSENLGMAMTAAILIHRKNHPGASVSALSEVGQDALTRTRLSWERSLALLAIIGNNAPFVGLLGTVIGIIQAFNNLSQHASGVQTVTAGLAEALIATAVGIFVAIPAVAAFNLFSRKVKTGVAEAEALKSYLIGKLS
ncbi:MAG: flagellar motor protein MotA [Bdellovibrionaceae bacterium]|nr:flagellar motor protein MotA [Pseudobdellovibrionaceae bacterium]